MKTPDLFDLTGKKALVTGGSYGLGFAMARALCEAGVKVGIIDISEKLEDAAKKLSTKNKKVIAIRADLSVRKSRKAAFEKFINTSCKNQSYQETN